MERIYIDLYKFNAIFLYNCLKIRYMKKSENHVLKGLSYTVLGLSILSGCGRDAPVVGAGKSAPTIQKHQDRTLADKLYESFLSELKSAREIKRVCYEPNAQYTLVHIKQSHNLPDEEVFKQLNAKTRQFSDINSKEMTETTYSQVDAIWHQKVFKVQEDIGFILMQLAAAYDVNSVYAEGITSENLLYFRQVKNNLEDSKKLYNNLIELYNKNPSTEFADKLKELDDAINMIEAFIFKEIGAPAFLYLKAEIDMLPAESSIILDELSTLGSKDNNSDEYSKVLFDKRENYLLEEIVRRQDNGIVLTVYGGAHNWKDNIERWNSEHPNQSFNLIEITPERFF